VKRLSRIFCLLLLTLLWWPTPSQASSQPIVAPAFAPCSDAKDRPELAPSLCARIKVPLDYRLPDDRQLSLFVRKFPAEKRPRGQLWLVAGGPGEAGASFYPFLASLRRAAPDYDLMIPDHRGTGFSTRLCEAEEAIGSAGGTALAGAEWASCFASLNANADRTRAFSSSNAAHDLRALIDGLSQGRPAFLYGVSYGTQLVLRTLTIAPPARLDGVILDSLVPPENSPIWDLSHRSAVVDAVGRRVLAACDRKPSCRASLGGSASAAMRDVLTDPTLGSALGDNPKYLFGAMLDVPEVRARIPAILSDLRNGKLASWGEAKRRLEEIGSNLLRYPQSNASIPLVGLISGSENNARPQLSGAIVAQEERNFLFASPLPGLLTRSGVPLYKRDDAFGKLPARMPPILVLHGTLDPKTPIEGAAAQIASLRTRGTVALLTVTDAPHFLLFTAPDCVVPVVHRFLTSRRARNALCRSVPDQPIGRSDRTTIDRP
jgi:pimeloyl-ACP methyl ester carboxylesterase